jgi:prepilin-type N-terminal cleavage/methylation domain-containing protein
MKTRLRRRGGFTLVEVSLALLVMAVGVLGAFALFPHALAESQRASAETQASMFAESVFQTLRARAQSNWNSVNSSFSILGPGAGVLGTPAVWSEPAKATIRAGSGVQTYQCNVMVNSRVMTEMGLRYRLQIDTESLNSKIVTLTVWPGLYGDTPDPAQYGVPLVPTYVYVSALHREDFLP